MPVQMREKNVGVSSSSLTPADFLTVRDLLALLKIKHPQTIYTLVKKGMPAIRVGKSFRFIKHEVIDYFRKNSQRNTKRHRTKVH